MLKSLRKATKAEYDEWKKGYYLNHILKYDKETLMNCNLCDEFEWNNRCVYIATKNFKCLPRYGVHAIVIIIPKGIKILNVDNIKEKEREAGINIILGHNKICFEDDFSQIGYGYLYLVNDDAIIPLSAWAKIPQKEKNKIKDLKLVFGPSE